MPHQTKSIDLGFTQAQVSPGSHICQIYVDDQERDDALFLFLSAGLLAKESAACFSENLDRSRLGAALEAVGLSIDAEQRDGRLRLSGAEAVYFHDGYFDPERMLALLSAFHDASVARACSGARIIGEMSPRISQIPGGSRLLEYEAKVNCTLRVHPLTAVCQYDARQFDGPTIMDVLTVHPMTLFRGTVVHNPFFVPPEEILRA